MPRLTREEVRLPLIEAHKQQLIDWYQARLFDEAMFPGKEATESTISWGKKTDRKTLFRMETESREIDAINLKNVDQFKKNLHRIPGVYYEVLHRVTSNFEEKTIKAFLDDPEKDYDRLYKAFLQGDHDLLHEIMGEMAEGAFAVKEPQALFDNYIKNACNIDLDDLKFLSVEMMDEKTIQETPEIKNNEKYSDKDRMIALKKEIARLEKKEKDRASSLQNDQKTAKGQYVQYLRQSGSNLSKDEIKAYNKRYSEYEEENRKLDAAKKSYYKTKLEQDKLRAKRDIFGKLSSREEKKLLEYEKKTIAASANCAVMKAQMLNDFDAKLEKEGKDPQSPHNLLRRQLIAKGDTRYIPLENEEITKRIYSSFFHEERMSTTPVSENISAPQGGRQIDVSSYISGEQVQADITRKSDEPINTRQQEFKLP